MANQDFELIQLAQVDSTNNYAMDLINDDKAHEGMTIVAESQNNGRGQRGRLWADEPGNSLLMSIIVNPRHLLSEQFVFSASIAVSIVNVLQNFLPETAIYIKWPNDIIIGDKKAGGILIENVIRGSKWSHSVIGLGLNVLQEHFPDTLPNATSIKMATGKLVSMYQLRERIREHIMSAVMYPAPANQTMTSYNDCLFRKDQNQLFSEKGNNWQAKIVRVSGDGELILCKNDKDIFRIYHGQAEWIWNGNQ